MNLTSKQIWAPYWFAIALSAICVVGNLAGYAWTGQQAVALLPFLCFLPHSFFLAAAAQKQSQERISVLEDRIGMLEAGRMAS